MTNQAIITVLMALGMSYTDADSSLDTYYYLIGQKCDMAEINAMWNNHKLYNRR